MKKVFYIFCFLSFAVSAQSLFSPLDKQHAEKALTALAMTPEDMMFEKDHGEPLWTLSWITNALNDPNVLPEVGDIVFQAAQNPESSMLYPLSAHFLELGESHPPILTSFIMSNEMFPEEVDEDLVTLIVSLANEMQGAYNEYHVAMSQLGRDDLEYLAASSLASTFNSELDEKSRSVLIDAGINREAQVRIELEAEQLDGSDAAKDWLKLLNKIDLNQLHPWSYATISSILKARDLFKVRQRWPEQIIRVKSPFGDIVIGTVNDDVFAKPAFLIIDPGGDDVYRNRAGSANGLHDQWVSAIIDLGGNDRYLSDGLLAPGSALFGFAVIIDEEGDDLYESDYVGTAAAIYGAAYVEDFEGDDIYRAQAICQGAGISGFGTLIDREGNDHYQAGFYGQGFAGVKGWGMLLDRAGNDVYVAGNVRRDSDRNEDRYLSLSQGFSIGARPHAGGGVAALIDLEGNDTYTADVYGQGVSYYYSAGFLIDAAGNDRYSMYQYGQGCGIHLSHGLLADIKGNDMYTGFILAQGAAHDYAVGMLFDHEGNDTYTADHHAQGRALNNAFAMLVDREGDDGYFGRQRDGSQGIGNEGGFRDYGSLALLLDLAGKDIYSGGFSNGMTTLRPLYGAVYDFEEEPEDD